jgi:hypothetical protein
MRLELGDKFLNHFYVDIRDEPSLVCFFYIVSAESILPEFSDQLFIFSLIARLVGTTKLSSNRPVKFCFTLMLSPLRILFDAVISKLSGCART